MASVTLDGVRFWYVEDGRGEPLMFVHGAVSDYRTWQSQREEFAKRFRVIAYSRRYNWPNEQIPGVADYSMIEQVDDLQAVLRLLDAAPAHLVRHSYGAFLCLVLAIREQHLVRTLTLAEPPVITLFVSSPPRPLELLKLLVTRPQTAAAIIRFGAKVLAPATQAFRDGDMEAGMHIFVDTVFGSEAIVPYPYPFISPSDKPACGADTARRACHHT
jgi:pimeloyl-ACP methyl ester carboxylesterase